jgi:Skp family chaperone for outer membrane proteins
MKKILSICFFISILSISYLSANVENYAVVDTQFVLQNSKAFQSFQKQIDEYRKELEKSFNEESEKLKKTEQELIEKRSDFSAKEFEKKKTDFEKSVAAFRKKVQEKQQNFDRVGAEVLQSIEKEAQKTVSEVAKEGKYQLVYQSAALSYSSEDKSITEEVLKRLNKSLSTVKVKKP